MSLANQNGIFVNVERTESKVFSNGIREPIKLILQFIYLTVVFLPYTLWSAASNLFTRSKDVSGNVVLVTGAGRGLGRNLALKFASLKCKVACVDIDETNNKETVRQIKQKYPNAVANAYRCNVALLEDIKCLSKNIANDMGEVDIVINNAGLVSGATLTNLKPEYISIMLDVNLKSHFLMIREFLPSMIQRNSGHIVAIASLAGLNGLANASVYSATKHGVIGLMESLYDELEVIPNNKVKTTCICPYFIHTNDGYSANWELRLPELSVEEASDATVDAIRKNKRIAAIPSVLYHSSVIMRLVPDNLRNLMKSIFYVRLTVPEKGEPNNIEAIQADTTARTRG